MSRLILFYRLIVCALLAEPVRTSLTVLAIALGVAVVLAIDLAGTAAAGSFHSSLETLMGDNDLEITATGGIAEKVVGTLAALPYALRISPRLEDYATVINSKQTLPLIGLDLIAEANHQADQSGALSITQSEDAWKYLGASDSIWVGASLGSKPGDRLQLLINDRVYTFTVRGTYPDASGNAAAMVLDISAAQRVLGRLGRVDRILLKVPQSVGPEEWGKRLKAVIPPGVEIRPSGAGTHENRRMLAAFRWNLRLLSYIALIVGAFLIYNTISISVVRRRAEIGIVRALGASRSSVLAAFVGEAACFGLIGALIGLLLGRLMASGAVKLMGATVQALYVSSRPGPIALSSAAVVLAIFVGVGVAMASAYSPAHEASLVPPVEAMARGRREYTARVHKRRDFWIALVFAAAGAAASRGPAVAAKPLLGYLAALLLIVASALAIPAMIDAVTFFSSWSLKRALGVEALLASRSLSASLLRTSVLVGALSTAIAMMTSVGIMVGSFRETVVAWMADQLPADLYVRSAGGPAADRHPTLSLQVADRIAQLPGVAGIDRMREYEISYEGTPATLGGVELNILRSYHSADFLSGRATKEVLSELRGTDAVIVSEPFANKHHLRAGDVITLPLGEARQSFRVVDVYYDYSSERGSVLMDRVTLLRYIPDPQPSSLAVYVAPGTPPETVRAEIDQASACSRIVVFSDRDLRGEALRIFDRTFAITYALEAVAVIVAVMGVAGSLLALVIDRRREYGLLRFLGAGAHQIRKLILIESGFIGLLSTLAGVALGFALSLILVYVINKQSFGWTIRFHWPVSVLLGALGVVFVATVLAGLYPAQVAVRLNPVEVVHEE
jgi:putative ABC transport system permease protein